MEITDFKSATFKNFQAPFKLFSTNIDFQNHIALKPFNSNLQFFYIFKGSALVPKEALDSRQF